MVTSEEVCAAAGFKVQEARKKGIPIVTTTFVQDLLHQDIEDIEEEEEYYEEEELTYEAPRKLEQGSLSVFKAPLAASFNSGLLR
jgi:hypothetical protein